MACATDAQGAAWLGHSSPHSFSTYRRQASRMLLTASAGELLAELRKNALGTRPEQKSAHKVQKSEKHSRRVTRQRGENPCRFNSLRWYRLSGLNGGPLDPQSSALTN